MCEVLGFLPSTTEKKTRKITRAQSKPPVSTPWHVDLEALCGLFMAFLEKETQRLFRQELWGGGGVGRVHGLH